jgi:hypothetical protein
MSYIGNIVRSAGDPKILSSGPSSMTNADKFGRLLGWISIGLGMAQLVSPRRVTRSLGMKGSEGLVRAFGAREVASGLLSLSASRRAGLWSRVAGDGLDLAALIPALRAGNPRRANAKWAFGVVLGLTALDLATAIGEETLHGKSSRALRTYDDRSGFPRGLNHVRKQAAQKR